MWDTGHAVGEANVTEGLEVDPSSGAKDDCSHGAHDPGERYRVRQKTTDTT